MIDLKTSLNALEWVVSGYALIIATLLITKGRLGNLYGRKKIFLLSAIFFGLGIGLTSAQLTNLIISAAPLALAGEASAANATVRQIGAAVWIAVFGLIFSLSFKQTLLTELKADLTMPPIAKYFIFSSLDDPVLSRQIRTELQRSSDAGENSIMVGYVKTALAYAGRTAIGFTLLPVLIATFAALKLKEKTGSQIK